MSTKLTPRPSSRRFLVPRSLPSHDCGDFPTPDRTLHTCDTMTSSVYFYVPNLIGYFRIACAFYGYSMALKDYQVTVFIYWLSQVLDAADGFAARALKQSSTFGAVLDMVTDRASTTCLCIVLAHYYPEHILGLTGLVSLDLFSHWFHVYASLLLGLGTHKQVDNALLRFYYWKPALFVVCSATEMWYMSLYTLGWTEGVTVPIFGGIGLARLMCGLCTPFAIFKQVANLVQMYVACEALVEHDADQRKRS